MWVTCWKRKSTKARKRLTIWPKNGRISGRDRNYFCRWLSLRLLMTKTSSKTSMKFPLLYCFKDSVTHDTTGLTVNSDFPHLVGFPNTSTKSKAFVVYQLCPGSFTIGSGDHEIGLDIQLSKFLRAFNLVKLLVYNKTFLQQNFFSGDQFLSANLLIPSSHISQFLLKWLICVAL